MSFREATSYSCLVRVTFSRIGEYNCTENDVVNMLENSLNKNGYEVYVGLSKEKDSDVVGNIFVKKEEE